MWKVFNIFNIIIKYANTNKGGGDNPIHKMWLKKNYHSLISYVFELEFMFCVALTVCYVAKGRVIKNPGKSSTFCGSGGVYCKVDKRWVGGGVLRWWIKKSLI